MSPPTVALAADHAGYELKNLLGDEIRRRGLAVLDLGPHDGSAVDYPDMTRLLAAALDDGRAQRGVLVCGTGIGVSIAANRHRHIRAALCHDVTTAILARRHNDANVLAMGSRVVGPHVALDCLAAFLDTGFEGGRHQRRIDKLA
jgi:ribose 5-phosphate isomerase B